MRIYFNGAVIATNDYTGSFSALKNGARFRLGRSVVDTEPFVDGQLDEVRVWKVAHTAEQIRQRMFESLTGTEEGLAGLWNFDNVENGVVRDATSGAHHGQLMGNAKTVEVLLPGSSEKVVVGNVLQLAGPGSYVELPPNIFRNLTAATVEGWVQWKVVENLADVFDFGKDQQEMLLGVRDGALQFKINHPQATQRDLIDAHLVRAGALASGSGVACNSGGR